MQPKRPWVRATCLLAIPLAVFTLDAARADSGAGCGLGQQIFEGQSGLVAHVAAATTNGSLSNQLFGLTFDSLGCETESVITAEAERSVFVAAHYDNIVRDVARGEGDHLATLAAVMRMTKPTDRDAFFAFTRDRYDRLFAEPVEDTDRWLTRLDAALREEPALASFALST